MSCPHCHACDTCNYCQHCNRCRVCGRYRPNSFQTTWIYNTPNTTLPYTGNGIWQNGTLQGTGQYQTETVTCECK